MKNDVITNIIVKLLRVGAFDKLEKILKTSTPREIRSLLSQLSDHQKLQLVNHLFQSNRASRTIRELSPNLFKELFNAVSLETIRDLIHRLQVDDAAHLLDKLEPEQAEWILANIDPQRKIQVSKLLAYAKNSAGAIMNPNFFALPQTATVTEAIEMLRHKTQLEMVFYLYVVDEEKHLVGIVSLRQLMMSRGESLLKEIMDTHVVQVEIHQPQSKVAQLISRYNFLAIPVVDEDKQLKGVITVDDVIEVIQDQAEQDLYRMAGLEKGERVFSPAGKSIKKRAPWLVINLATAILAIQVVGLFEGTIQKAVMLAVFLPVVAGMGGNAGTQTLTIIIRGLAIGELVIKDVWRALAKETFVGIANGIITGAIMAIVAYYWKGIPMLGVILMLSMIGNLLISSLTGVLVPIGLKAVKIDPAVASTVIVTTFTDCFGFFSFLGLAALFLKYLI